MSLRHSGQSGSKVGLQHQLRELSSPKLQAHSLNSDQLSPNRSRTQNCGATSNVETAGDIDNENLAMQGNVDNERSLQAGDSQLKGAGTCGACKEDPAAAQTAFWRLDAGIKPTSSAKRCLARTAAYDWVCVDSHKRHGRLFC